jgi:hypothetical protein
MKKKVLNFSQQKYNVALSEVFASRIEAKELVDALSSFDGCENLEQVETYLKEKTGFVNVQLSASALGVEKEYNTINEYFDVLDLSIYEDNFTKLSDKFIDGLKEQFTEYWSNEDAIYIDKVEKELKAINKLDIPNGLYVNGKNEVVFNAISWRTHRQFSRP